MASQAQAVDQDEWDFDLGERVTLLWLLETEGQIVGRKETVYSDDEYEVEFVDKRGLLVRQWVGEQAIDHAGTQH